MSERKFPLSLSLMILALCGVLGAATVFTSRSKTFVSIKSTSQSNGGSKVGSTTEAEPTPYLGMLSLPSEENSWMVKIDAAGGFIGNVIGGAVTTSQGNVAAGGSAQIGKFRYDCKAQLSVEELRRLEQAVLLVKPSSWKEHYIDPKNPDACCDQVGYGLQLFRRKKDGTEMTYSASWYDSSTYLLPADLTALHETMQAIQDKTLKECQNQ